MATAKTPKLPSAGITIPDGVVFHREYTKQRDIADQDNTKLMRHIADKLLTHFKDRILRFDFASEPSCVDFSTEVGVPETFIYPKNNQRAMPLSFLQTTLENFIERTYK